MSNSLPCPSPNSHNLLKLMSIELVMPSNRLILCHPLLLLPSVFPSIRVFSNEYSGLISFRIGWLDILAVQGTLKSLLQHHSSKHQFFCTQPSLWSNSHIHTWLLEKTIALTRWTFVGKVMSLIFNLLSRLVTAFLPRSKQASRDSSGSCYSGTHQA